MGTDLGYAIVKMALVAIVVGFILFSRTLAGIAGAEEIQPSDRFGDAVQMTIIDVTGDGEYDVVLHNSNGSLQTARVMHRVDSVPLAVGTVNATIFGEMICTDYDASESACLAGAAYDLVITSAPVYVVAMPLVINE